MQLRCKPDLALYSVIQSSGVPRILEWEGLKCRRRRKGETWIPSPLGEGSGEGDVPPPRKIFFVFLLKIPYFDPFWHVYFLNHTPIEGVLTPLTPSSVRHRFRVKESAPCAVCLLCYFHATTHLALPHTAAPTR